jgi:hypothetical protein
VREGLAADAIERVLREEPEARRALVAAETGLMPQREFEAILGRLVGIAS